MPKFKVLKDFTYFHRGYDRAEYKVGDVIETDDEEMAEVAISQKWAVTEELDDQPKPAQRGRNPKSKE